MENQGIITHQYDGECPLINTASCSGHVAGLITIREKERDDEKTSLVTLIAACLVSAGCAGLTTLALKNSFVKPAMLHAQLAVLRLTKPLRQLLPQLKKLGGPQRQYL